MSRPSRCRLGDDCGCARNEAQNCDNLVDHPIVSATTVGRLIMSILIVIMGVALLVFGLATHAGVAIVTGVILALAGANMADGA